MNEVDVPSGRWTQEPDGSWVRSGDATESLAARIRSLLAAAVPPGVIQQYAGATAPAGWALCDGTAVGRKAYPALFELLGTTYGAGDGSTTFNLPNLKGRVPVGRDSGQTEFDVLGETGGAKTHVLTEAEMPNHGHAFTGQTFTPAGAGGYVASSTGGTGAGGPTGQWSYANTGGGGAHNNLQPYLVLNYIIRLG